MLPMVPFDLTLRRGSNRRPHLVPSPYLLSLCCLSFRGDAKPSTIYLQLKDEEEKEEGEEGEQ